MQDSRGSNEHDKAYRMKGSGSNFLSPFSIYILHFLYYCKIYEVDKMFRELNHKTYHVGGSVRDELLGKVPKDYDFVIEATEEEFRKHFPCEQTYPLVGTDKPVFLVQGNDVALTRTEESTGNGYGDFVCKDVGVPILEDLGRRDFTICSMARHYVTGDLLDPHNGQEDLERKLIRTVFEQAFVEDPVRILRAARFAARFEFTIETRTMELMRESAHMLQYATKERIVKELEEMYAKAYTPSIFFKVLAEADALKYQFPELEALRHVPAGPNQYHGDNTGFDHTMEAIDRARDFGYSFDVFLAALAHDFGKATTPSDVLPHHYGHEVRSEKIARVFVENHRFTHRAKKFIPKAARNHMYLHLLDKMKPVKLIRMYRSVGRDFFQDFIKVGMCDHPMEETQLFILGCITRAVAQTRIELTPETLKKGNEAVTAFVETRQAETLGRLLREAGLGK